VTAILAQRYRRVLAGSPVDRPGSRWRDEVDMQAQTTSEPGAAMSTIHLKETTTATPKQFIDALTDFGPGRSKLCGNSAIECVKVHDRSPAQADVTEGLGRHLGAAWTTTGPIPTASS
jgi:hypothetical protein